MINTTSAPMVFISGGIHSVETWTNMPTTSEPTRAPYAVPRPPRVTPANISRRIC